MDVEPVLNEIDEVLILDKSLDDFDWSPYLPQIYNALDLLEEDQTVDVKQENVKIEEMEPEENDDFSDLLKNSDDLLNKRIRKRQRTSDSGYLSSVSDESDIEPLDQMDQKKRPKLTKWLFRKLSKPKKYGHIITWVDKSQQTFKILDKEKISQMWGLANGHQHLAYENFTRAIRYYYKSHEMEIVRKKMIYRFGENAPHLVEAANMGG